MQANQLQFSRREGSVWRERERESVCECVCRGKCEKGRGDGGGWLDGKLEMQLRNDTAIIYNPQIASYSGQAIRFVKAVQ